MAPTVADIAATISEATTKVTKSLLISRQAALIASIDTYPGPGAMGPETGGR